MKNGMMEKRRSKLEFVVCLKNRGYAASLQVHKIYQVLVDDDAENDGDLRVIDESGEDPTNTTAIPRQSSRRPFHKRETGKPTNTLINVAINVEVVNRPPPINAPMI